MVRRRSAKCAELNVCPMCKKVVEYGVVCECCASWFHATEQCCGDVLVNAFQAGRDAWCCMNCTPQQAEPAPPSALKRPVAAIEHQDWRRAYRILTDSCGGCNLKVRVLHSTALASLLHTLAGRSQGPCARPV